METPLFGEETRRDKIVQFAVGGLLFVGVLLTGVFSLVNGGSALDIVLAVAIIGLFAVIVVLWQWYRVGDLDPKFKYLIGGVVALLLMFIVVSNLYYAEPEIADLCSGQGNQFYDTTTGACKATTSCQQDFCLIYLNGGWLDCVYNCTGLVPPPVENPTEGPTRAPEARAL